MLGGGTEGGMKGFLWKRTFDFIDSEWLVSFCCAHMCVYVCSVCSHVYTCVVLGIEPGTTMCESNVSSLFHIPGHDNFKSCSETSSKSILMNDSNDN